MRHECDFLVLLQSFYLNHEIDGSPKGVLIHKVDTNDPKYCLDMSVEDLDRLEDILETEIPNMLINLNLNVNSLMSLQGIENFLCLRILCVADNKLSDITGLRELKMLEILDLDRNLLSCLDEMFINLSSENF